jgi:hypothetical protein
MKTSDLIAGILAICLVVLNPFAQTSSKQPVNSLKGGKWAASFLLGTPSGPEEIGSFNLTLKSQITKVFAIRLGASAFLNSGEGNNVYEGNSSPQNQSNTNANIFLNFLFYTNPTKPFSFYAGLGPVYQYKEYKSEYLPGSSPFGGASYTSERGSAFGGFAVLGAEWFAFSGFSLTAEYNLSYTFGNSNRTSTFVYTGPFSPPDYDVTVTDNDVQTLNLNIVKIGFSAYF